MAEPFKHYLVMDFEATCDSDEIEIVDVSGCDIQCRIPHRLSLCDSVKYWTTSRNCCGGRPLLAEGSGAGAAAVGEGQEFFARPTTPTSLRLYSSAQNAENDMGALVFKQGSGTGTLLQDQSTIRKVHQVSPSHQVVIPNHRLCTGTHAKYHEGSSGALTVLGRKLQSGSSVFVRSVDSCTLQLHSSKQDSEANVNPIALDEVSELALQPLPSSSSTAMASPSLVVKPGIHWTPEIIEFPCVLLHAGTLEVMAEFRRLVRPTENPVLPAFTTELTSIRQEEVDEAEPLETVLREFEAWLEKEEAQNGLPVTCGDWDLNQMLPTETKRKGIQGIVPPALHRWCNIKKPFSEALACKPMGMDGMLQKMHIDLVGHHHLGIDDARNIAKIVQDLVVNHRRTIDVTAQLTMRRLRQ